MYRFDDPEIDGHPEPSRQKGGPISMMLAQGSTEEDGFFWSLIDLVTLLLIFFIFLYSQSVGKIDPYPSDALFQPDRSQPMIGEAPAAKGPTLSDFLVEAIPPTQPAAIELSMSTEEAISPAESARPRPQPLTDREETEKEEPIGQICEEALETIAETDKGSCSVKWNQHRLVFVLGEGVIYPVGQATLLKDFEPTLRRIAGFIAAKKGYQVVVSGHTDNVPIYTSQFPSNWELSANRAITVAKYLIQNGVDPSNVSIQGYSEYRPVIDNSTPENRQFNRRVEIALIKQKNEWEKIK